MKHFKVLYSFLLLMASLQGFSIVIDNFRGVGESGVAVTAEESDLVASGYAITRSFGDNVYYTEDTKFIRFTGSSADYIQYDFTSPLGALNLSKTPVIRLAFAPNTYFDGTTLPAEDENGNTIKTNPFSISVDLKDDSGKFLSSSSQQAAKNPSNTLSFDFSSQFSQIAKFTPPSFNYNRIRQIYVNLNSTATDRSPNVATFEIEEIEAVAAAPVPEPISMVALGTGVAILTQKRRKNNKNVYE